MKFACDACHAQYMIADEKVRDRAVKVKCKKCDHVIVVRPPKVSAEAPAFEEREGTLDERMGDRHPGLEHAENMGLGGATEESGQLPSMSHDSNEIDSDETHILEENEALSAAANFGAAAEGASDVVPEAPPAAAADATHVALNPLAGMRSEDFNPPADSPDDPPESAFAPPTDLIATTQGEALGASGEAPIGADENINTVVSAPNVFDDSNAFGGDLALGGDLSLDGALEGDDDAGLSPFASDEAPEDDITPPPALASDDPMAVDAGEAEGDGVPEPPSGDEVEAALSGEGAAVDEPPPFAAPDQDEAAFGMPDVPSFDDHEQTGKSTDHEDPTVAGTAADLSAVAADDPAEEQEEGRSDELDEQLAGAFNQMFSEPGALPFPDVDDAEGLGHHDPTSVIAPEEMDALRGQAGATSQLFREDASFDDMATMNASDEGDEPEWHVAIDDEDVGPLSLAEVRDEVTSGRLLRDSLVWKVGMDDWYPAEDVAEIADLFVPAPRSLEAGGAAGLAGFDVGEPVDDMGPSPFGGPENSDPFGQVHDLHDDPDPSWQPHGLTDVYQAANLAEAGGAAPPPPAMDLPTDDESEGGWRPGAASALSALVANEIERIESSPEESEGSPLLPADGPSQDGPAEASGPALLDGIAGPELSGGIAAAPFDADLGPKLDAGQPLAPYGGGPQAGAPPIYPAVPPPAQPGRSNLILALIGLAGLVILMVGVVAVVAVLKMSGNSGASGQVATGQNPNGAAGTVATGAQPPGSTTKGATTDTKAKDEDKKAEEAEGNQAKATPGEDDKKEEPTKVAMVAKKDPPKEAKPDKAKAEPTPAEVKKEPKESTSRSRSRSRSRASKPKPKPEPKPTPKPRPRPSVSKDCDPVLDFDCDEKKARPKKKRTLSKSDILSTVKRKIGTINACGRKHNVKGSVKMRWQIAKSGSTKRVKTLTSKYKGSPVGSCLESAIRRWKFPSYTGKAPGNIDFPFKLK